MKKKLKKYEKFENNIENQYSSKYEELNLMNPSNYIKGRQYDRSIKNNTDDISFISFY
jgi:hypothetical protein